MRLLNCRRLNGREHKEFRNVLERLIILCRDEITGADVLAYARPVSGSNIL